MGCDIHAFVEVKEEGKWRQLKNAFFQEWNDSYGDEVDLGRDYELFAFLADVRNYNEIKPIASPKGIPNDASHGYLAEVEDWDVDGHSHSWFTLAELKKIPKELLEQEFYDSSLILKKDKDGTITEICKMTTGKHLGKVGNRKLFGLWGRNPIKELIKQIESACSPYTNDDVRFVFFFDN